MYLINHINYKFTAVLCIKFRLYDTCFIHITLTRKDLIYGIASKLCEKTNEH